MYAQLIVSFAKKNIGIILLSLIFLLHIFLRFYQLEYRFQFGYDQIDSAWAAKRILIDHNYPLAGPANKLGSGIFVGPLYYYIISIFYFFTNMDPIAGAYFAGVTSIITFFAILLIVKRLFSFYVGLIAICINTISLTGIEFDRIQWEPNFIPAVSLLVFYSLYKIITKNEKYILLLAIALGASFHVHLTAAFFLSVITLPTLPFFPKNKNMLKCMVFSAPLFILWLMPIIVASTQKELSLASNSVAYANSSIHGLHLTRVLQLFPDAFYQFFSFIPFSPISFLRYLFIPLFILIYFLNKPSRKGFLLCYLVVLWFIAPWFFLSLYSGEISNYYYTVNRPIALMIIAFIVYQFLTLRKKIITLALIIFTLYYSYNTLSKFFAYRPVGLHNYRVLVKDAVAKGKKIEFVEGKTEWYLYYIYTRKK